MSKNDSVYNKAAILVGMFLMISLIGFTMWFSHLFPEEGVVSAKKLEEEKVHRQETVEGDFVDRNGNIIMEPKDPTPQNSTILDLSYSYLLGYNHISLGSSGLRKLYNEHLYDDKGTGKGGTVQLTIDDALQKKAYALLKGNNYAGSIIVLNAKTGEILTMASRREADYDLTYLTNEKFESYKTMKDPMDRTNMFIDPAKDPAAPGSVFKIVTACAAIENGLAGHTYNDTGSYMALKPDGSYHAIKNYGGHPYGPQNLESALVNSVNTYFASLAVELGEKALYETAAKFYIGNLVSLGFANLTSVIKFDGNQVNLAQIGWGQGALSIAPLHMATIAQSIVNDGTMCTPYVTKALYDVYGRQLVEDEGKGILGYPIYPETARQVKEMMKVVTENYVKKSGYPNLFAHTENVYCKTGTADLKDDISINNAYFLCMTDDYVILTTVINTTRMGGNLVQIADSILSELY